MKKLGENIKLVLIPLLFFILIFGILNYQNLQVELKQPDEGWSRSVPLDTGNVKKTTPVVYQEDGRERVYVPKENEVMSFDIDKKLNISHKQTTPIAITDPQHFWTKNGEFVYVKGMKLIHYDGKKENVIDNDVYSMYANQHAIIYIKEHEVLSLDPNTWKKSSIQKVNDRLESVVLNDQSSSFLVTGSNIGKLKMLNAYYYQKTDTGYIPHLILSKEEPFSQNYFNFYFVENKDQLTVYYSLFQNLSGGKSYTLYQGTNKIGSNTDWQFSSMKFVDDKGVDLANPKYIQYGVDSNNHAKILFTTRAFKSPEKRAVNVYEAKPKNNVWVAERRSTTNYDSVNPNWVGDNTIFWMNLVNKTEYTFSGASQDPEIIKMSLKGTSEDYKQATSNTLLSLFQGFVLALSALYWIIPSVLFAIIIYLFKIKWIEEEDKRIMYTIVVLYLAVQLLFMQKFFNGAYQLLAPGFLKFTGSSLVIPIFVALVSWFAVKFGKKSDWGMLMNICYFVAVNIILLSITIGPYLF